MKPLTSVDIVMSIYNQEKIIEYILEQLFKNTVTPFTLILIFDGCTDATKPKTLAFIENKKTALLQKLIIQDAPNVYETQANNIGFKLVTSDYFVTLQDDMAILEPGWEVRLTYPLRKFDNIFAVTGRIAQDIEKIDSNGRQLYVNRAGREFNSLPRKLFKVRDVINRGPIAFRTDYLQKLHFLNEAFAPSDLDDADLSLRAWTSHKWRCGAFWIDYFSDSAWSKAKASDSTMAAPKSQHKNAIQLSKLHADYLNSHVKHDADIMITEEEIDYPAHFDKPVLQEAIKQSQKKYLSHYYKQKTHWLIKKGPKELLKKILTSVNLYTPKY